MDIRDGIGEEAGGVRRPSRSEENGGMMDDKEREDGKVSNNECQKRPDSSP